MKKFILKIIKFFDYELPWWVCVVLGLILSIVPLCYAAVRVTTSLEPGFDYGVCYGCGLTMVMNGFLKSFDKK